MIIYTAGVWDLFHVGHLRLLKRIRKDFKDGYLVVGISTDELAEKKGRKPVIPFDQRWEIIEALGLADKIVLQDTFDKNKMKEEVGFDIVCVGNDHKEEWDKEYPDLKIIRYYPYTSEISTTKIYERIRENTTKV